MRYRLALDLGSTSIGWAVFLLNQSSPPRAKALVRSGVRIFPNSRSSAPGRQGESLAKARREKRQARRRRDRLLKRKDKLITALVTWGLFPQNIAERKALERLNPYDLRARGLSEKLSLYELGRAIFHLNQRRGFLSNRKTDSADKNEGPLKTAIAKLRTELGHSTVGVWLNERRIALKKEKNIAVVRVRRREEARPNKRNPEKETLETVFDFFIDRAMVEVEFDALWAAQAKFHSEALTEDARKEIKDIVFFQRKLRPVSPGRCSLLPNLRRAYKAFPVIQRLRIYQEVNHLEILDEQLRGHPLSTVQRDVIAKELLKGHDLTFTKIRKLLKLPASALFNYENGGDKREGLSGDETANKLGGRQYFGSHWSEKFDPSLRHRIVWKLLHSQSFERLVAWLMSHTRRHLCFRDSLRNFARNAGVRHKPSD